jgi:hypothetical protein
MIGTVLFLLIVILFLGEHLTERARRRTVAGAFDDANAFADHGPRWTSGS